ncbi:unnamed protein product [Nezara viridula]|uniref:Uncharacterized protein n=1 Tax=Nezara viridula TaxID=85310 RepID=A0A9P0HMG7_NEZVI|nr:unnamed protein product [Nezara viridula]
MVLLPGGGSQIQLTPVPSIRGNTALPKRQFARDLPEHRRPSNNL